MTGTDDRPRRNLGHLVLPRTSAAQGWLERQKADKEKATEIVYEAIHSYFPAISEHLARFLAERIVSDLDTRL